MIVRVPRSSMFIGTRRHILYLTSQSTQFKLFIRRHVTNGSNVKSANINEGGKMPDVQDAQQAERRRKFWELENEIESQVDYTSLTEAEQLIHRTHAEAVARGHFTYDDPENGDRVFTRLRHFLKGSCCGSACRHVSDHHHSDSTKSGRAFHTFPQDFRCMHITALTPEFL